MPAYASVAPIVKTEIEYAGFWRRVLAFIVDQTLLWSVDLGLIFGAITLGQNDLNAVENAAAVGAALEWAYYAVLESSPARGTLGKLAFDLYVADTHGDPIGFWRAVFRYRLKLFSSLLLGIGWLMPGFTPRKQALHDLLAGTLVLRRVRILVIGQEPPKDPGDYWDGRRWVASISPLEK